jgi:DNA repair protein RAD7
LEWKSARGETRDDEEGGISLLAKDFKQAASISASNQTLIEVDDPYRCASKNGDADGWSDVQGKSWHTKSTGPTSTSANSHTCPSTTSVTGTQRSYASSVAERSDVSDVRPNGWARIPRGPPMVSTVKIQALQQVSD